MNEFIIIIVATSLSVILIDILNKKVTKPKVQTQEVDLTPVLININDIEKRFTAYEKNFEKANQFWHTAHAEQKRKLNDNVLLMHKLDTGTKKSIHKINKVIYKDEPKEDNKITEKLNNIKTISI